MGNVTITYRPLTNWPAGQPHTAPVDREEARFKAPSRQENPGTPQSRYVPPKAIPLEQTLNDLDRELYAIEATDAVLQVDVVSERELRRDGVVSAQARVNSPAVVLSFTREKAPYVFACDHFDRWQDNVRALALGLESLRRVERYHLGRTNAQYTGWRALPAAGMSTLTLSTNQAANVIARHSLNGNGGDVETVATRIVADVQVARESLRRAKAHTHPNAGGANQDWTLVQEAERILEAHHGAGVL